MLIGWDRGHFSFILEIAPDNDQHLENIKKRLNFALKFYNFIDGKCFKQDCFCHSFKVIETYSV